MYLVILGWLYVALMMAVAEAMHSNGTVLGAIVTFILYGLLPLGLVVYVMNTPHRKRALRAREQAEWEAQKTPATGHETSASLGAQAASHQAPETASDPSDAGGHAPTGTQDGGVATVRKES